MNMSFIPYPRFIIRDPRQPPCVYEPIRPQCAGSLDWAAALMKGDGLPDGCLTRQSLTTWRDRHGPLPDGFHPDEGYVMCVDASGVSLAADTDAGFRHALQTLAQLLAQSDPGSLPALTLIDWPAMRRRCAHICYHLATHWMPQSVPNFEALLRLIRLAAHFKMNAILLELEAMFPHRKHASVSARNAFTPYQIDAIGRVCAECGVDIIPLLQSLGHAYHVLRHPEYAHLRETPATIQQYCPSNRDVLPVFLELADEIRSAFPTITRFHIGGDESRRLGICTACREKAGHAGIGRLYGDHLGAVARAIMERDLTPMIWTDMIEHHPDAADAIPEGTEFVYWKYALPRHGEPIDFEPFMRRGGVWAAAGIRFGTCNHTMYRFPEAMQGISFLAAEAQRAGCDSFLATDWMKAVPFELAEPGYAYAAEIAWGARRTLRAFFDDYASLANGRPNDAGTGTVTAHGRDLIDIFTVLAFPLIPYCEDAQTRMPDRLDRYDLSGLTIRERIARQMDASESESIHAALTDGLNNARLALDRIHALRPRLTNMRRLLDMLELSARTHAHKASLGLAIGQVIPMLKFPCRDDARPRQRLAERIAELAAEHGRLRDRTRELLEPVMAPEHLAANLDVKFEPALIGWLDYFQTALQRGEALHSLLGPECAPCPPGAPPDT